MKTEQIANRQLLFILYIIRSNTVITVLPVLTSADARQDAWVAALIAFGGTLVTVGIIAGLGGRHPDQTLVEFGQKLLGKWPGRMVAVVVLWSFLHLTSIHLRLYGEMITTAFLPLTPVVFVSSAMVLLSAYAAYMGVEVIGRLADLLFPVFVVGVALTLLAATGAWRWENLQPVLGRGVMPAMRAAVTPIAVSADFMVLAILIPSLTEPRKALGTSLVATALAFLTLVVVAVAVVAVLGADAGARTVFPFLQMARSLRVTEFLERIEAPAVWTWGMGVFVVLSTYMYCGARGLSQLLRVADYRPLILPMAVHWTVLSLHAFEDMFQLRAFLQPRVFGPYALALVLVPYGLLWAAHAVRGLQRPGRGKSS